MTKIHLQIFNLRFLNSRRCGILNLGLLLLTVMANIGYGKSDNFQIENIGSSVGLQRILNQIESKLQSLSVDVKGLLSRIKTLETKQTALNNSVTVIAGTVVSLQTQILTLAAGYDKLDAINVIWKRNFKIVNTTFIALRGKVTFNIVPINGL